MNYEAQVRKASRDSRKEAEAFVASHAHVTKGVSEDDIETAVRKITRVL